MADEPTNETVNNVNGANEARGEPSADEIEISDNWDETTPTFDALGLKEELLRGIYAYGFERPSAIQQVRMTALANFIFLAKIYIFSLH